MGIAVLTSNDRFMILHKPSQWACCGISRMDVKRVHDSGLPVVEEDYYHQLTERQVDFCEEAVAVASTIASLF